MKFNNSTLKPVLLATTLCVTGYFSANVLASEVPITNTSTPSISLSDAVAKAESYTGAKATRAEYETSKQGHVYDVELVNQDHVFKTRIDALKGQVLSSSFDKIDHTDEQDHGDQNAEQDLAD